MKEIKSIAFSAIFASLVLVTTAFIRIPLSLAGYIHLGDVVILIACYYLRPHYAALSCGIGSMLADLVSGYAVYMPATFVIKGAVALVASILMRGKFSVYKTALSAFIGGIIVLLGYFLFEWLVIFKSAPAAQANLLFSSIQPAVCGVVAFLIILQMRRIKLLERFREELR